MKTCPVCGKPMEDDELFCSACGAKYEEPVQSAEGEGGFCPECGSGVEAGTVFCPNCGAKVTNQAPAATAKPKAKVSVPKIAGFAVAGAAAVAVLVLVVNLLLGIFATPADKFVTIQKKTLEALVLNNLSAAGKTYNNMDFSTDLTLSASAKNDFLDKVLEDSQVVVKLDMKSDSLLFNGEVKLMGDTLLSGILTYDKGKLGVCLPEVDSNYYVISLDALYELMGIDAEELDRASNIKAPKLPTDAVNKLIKSYTDIIATAVTKDNTTQSDKSTIRLAELGEKMEGELYIFKPKAEDIEEMILKLADRLEKDKDLRKLVSDFLKDNSDLMEAMLTDSYYDVDDLEEMLDEALVELADELRDNAEDIGEAVEKAGFKWSVGISKGKLCLEKIEFNGGELTYESTGEKSVLYVAEDGKKDFSIGMECKEKDGLLRGKISFTYSSYSYYYGTTEETVSLSFKNVNLKKSSYLGIPYGSYTLEADGESLKLDVEAGDKGGTDHTVSLPGTYISGVGYVEGLKVTLNTSDKKSTAAKPKGKTVDISSYDEGDLRDLIWDIGNELEDILDEVYDEVFW